MVESKGASWNTTDSGLLLVVVDMSNLPLPTEEVRCSVVSRTLYDGEIRAWALVMIEMHYPLLVRATKVGSVESL